MTAPTELDTHVLERATARLAERYEGLFEEELVRRIVFESYTTLSRTARVRTHLTSLATNFADTRLRALALAEGRIPTTVPQVLFVCVQNAGRSQLAAALLRRRAGDAVEIRSAGSLPASEVHPLVLAELRRRDIDAGGAFPKPLTDDVVRASDYVVTMGCGDVCPVYPGTEYLDWELEDPEAADAAGVRDIADRIDAEVARLWERISS